MIAKISRGPAGTTFTGGILNKNMVRVRKSLQMSQAQFGEFIGMTQANVSLMENNPDHNPSGKLLQLVAKKLPTLNFRWLFTGDGPMWLTHESGAGSMLLPAQVSQNQKISELEKEVARLRRSNKLLKDLLVSQ